MNQKITRDALVICITQYTDLKMSAEMTALTQGAEKIARLLETKGGFRVKRLPVTKLDSDKEFIDPEQMVMAEELKLAIKELFRPEGDTPPTTALLFFAGHGLRQKIKEADYQGFLASSYAYPKENKWDGVSLQWLRQLLEQSPVQQQIVWIDACYSGELFNFTAHDSVHDRCFISSARAHEEAYAAGVLTDALLKTLDYTKQLNPWIDHLTLTEGLKIENKKAVGSQRFVFDNTDKPITLTNKAFDLDADYKNVCPFKGLESFDFEKNPDDPLYFKGRTQLTNELLEKVQSANFLAVLGASGNGKSSVVRAGLLYSIEQTQRWQILPVITPTAHPLKALGTVIGMPAEQLTDFINQAQTERIVLVIDQFEEIFTLRKNDAEREQFFAILLAAVERADNKFCLIIVMRADFLDKCSHHVNLAKQIQNHQIIVTPMTPAELEEAIVAPTQQVGLQIEPKLVSEMLADVKGALGSLPLLQYTLTQLWKQCATQSLLTFSAYEELGKIAGTLEQGANGVYQKLSPAEQKTAKWIFTRLAQPVGNRQAPIKELENFQQFKPALVNEVIQKLVAANLLITDKLQKKPVAVVNIAHEALTQHWGQLCEWLDENREAIKIQHEIEVDAKRWQDNNHAKNALLQGIDLNFAEDYINNYAEEMPFSNLAQEFVQVSQIERDRSLKKEEERIKRELETAQKLLAIEKLRKKGIILTFSLIIATGMGLFAVTQWRMTTQQNEIIKQQSEITAFRYKGLLAERAEQPQQALKYYQQTLEISRNINDQKAQINNLSDIGTMYLNLDKPELALHNFKAALKIREQLGDPEGVRFEQNNIVLAYGKLGQVEKALELYQQANRLEEKGTENGKMAAFRVEKGKESQKMVAIIDSINCSSNVVEFLSGGTTRKSQLYIGMILNHADQLKVIKENCSITLMLNGEMQIVDKSNSPYIVEENQPGGLFSTISEWVTNLMKRQERERANYTIR